MENKFSFCFLNVALNTFLLASTHAFCFFLSLFIGIWWGLIWEISLSLRSTYNGNGVSDTLLLVAISRAPLLQSRWGYLEPSGAAFPWAGLMQKQGDERICKSVINAFLNCRLWIKDAAMKDPSRSSTSPSIISEDVIINGHSHEDDNPFAEYMWMENEEEFNRQASRFPL